MSLAKLITNFPLFSPFQKVPSLTLSSTKAFSTCEVANKKPSYEELGIPEPPQKPIKPFNKFIKENKDFMSHLTWKERLRLLAEKYDDVSSEEKIGRMKEYMDNKIEYQQNHMAFMSRFTPEQAEIVEKIISKSKPKSKTAMKSEAKALEKSLGKPSLPVNAFIKFMVGLKSSQKNYSIKEAAELWKSKSDSERNELNALHLKEVEQYKQKLSLWEEKMLNEGRYDLIRKTSPVFKNK